MNLIIKTSVKEFGEKYTRTVSDITNSLSKSAMKLATFKAMQRSSSEKVLTILHYVPTDGNHMLKSSREFRA